MLPIVNNILGDLTIAAQIFLLCFDLGWLFFANKMRKAENFLPFIVGIILAFIIALVATLGSLFYSQIAKFVPCELCWFQRIFMYPQVFLLGMALWRKDRKIVDYSLILALVGLAISAYHNYLIYFPTTSAVCGTDKGTSCAQLVILSFNYISIPLMSLTAFWLMISMLLWQRHLNKIK